MKKYLLPILLIAFWSCEDKEEESYTIYDLPQEFPLDKNYAWEYERTYYDTKSLWESELLPDTSYLDTLYVSPTENEYSFYWWGNNPTTFSLVKNQEDGNHFIRIGRYYIENDSIAFYEKPNLWANYDSNFDTTGYSDIFYSFNHNRTAEVDTSGNTITHSYVESKNLFYDNYEYYYESKKNIFGGESYKVYRDYTDDTDLNSFSTNKKQREIDASSTSMVLILSEFYDQLNQTENWYSNARMSQIYSDDRIQDHGIW